MGKKLSYIEKRAFKNKEKKLDKRHYAILIGLVLFFILLRKFSNTIIIGEDIRFTLLTGFLPLITGIILLIIYRKEFLILMVLKEKNKWVKAFMLVFYLIQGAFVSYLALVYPSQVIFTEINKNISSNNRIEMIECGVEKFFDARRSVYIEFKYKNNWEHINISHEQMKMYIHENPDNYILELTVKKGIWNSYIVQQWELHTKQ